MRRTLSGRSSAPNSRCARACGSDRALCTLASALLLSLSAWPLLLARVPPLQDLPAHLATATVIRHPEDYPNLVFHGFFKTNSSLFAFLWPFGDAHLLSGAKLFVLLTLAAYAWVVPRLVLELGGRARVPLATLLAIPLAHNWFVAMGMLDYALGSALALGCVLLAARQRRAPLPSRALALGVLGILVWYTHVFALAMVALLAAIEALRARRLAALRPYAPLVLALGLAAWSVLAEVGRAHAASVHRLSYRPVWETAYELWAKYAWAFSKAELASLVPFGVLAWALFRGRHEEVPLLSAPAVAALLVMAFVVPSEMLDWFAVNSRVLPFLYAAALVRAPERVPTPLVAVVAAAGLACSAGLGYDYLRLGREMDAIAAGVDAVPERADLFPCILDPKGSSENTWALANGWGLYVVAKRTSAPLVFAHSPSFPLGYRTPPPEDEHPLRLAELAQSRSAAARAELARIAARHAWVLAWGDDVEPPPSHALRFERGELRIYGAAPP